MKPLSHQSAKASHYDQEANSYDAFNDKNSEAINQLIETLLRKYEVKTVLDLTCGTGSQGFWLTQKGYEVTGVDINLKMLEIARKKAAEKKLNLSFTQGDMRSIKVGEFDVILTIFNSIGHLTKDDFEKAICNIGQNLKQGGLYLFDIFNLNYLLDGDNITKLTVDWQETLENQKVREIQYSTINDQGILTSYDLYYEQVDSLEPTCKKCSQTLQVYTSEQLKEILEKNGFKVLKQCDLSGSTIIEGETERIFTLAQKQVN